MKTRGPSLGCASRSPMLPPVEIGRARTATLAETVVVVMIIMVVTPVTTVEGRRAGGTLACQARR